MRTFPFSLLAWACTMAAAFGASSIDFTPLPREVKFEGTLRRFVQFRCRNDLSGREMMSYTPPWPITGSGEQATMMIPGTDATAALRRVRTQFSLDFEDEEQILAWAGSYLPQYAEALKFDPVEQNPLLINGQATVHLVARYTLFGRPVAHSLVLCRRALSRDTELFVFELQAKPAELKQFDRPFLRSLHSLVGF